MQIDMNEQLVRVGSLVMWNREHSEDFGCVGIVIDHYFEKQSCDQPITEFSVLWADNDRVEYDYGDLWRKHIKVVIF